MRVALRVGVLLASAGLLGSVTAVPAVAEGFSANEFSFGMSAPTLKALERSELRLDETVDLVSVYADFTSGFPVRAAEAARQRGAALLVAWEPWDWERFSKEDATGYHLNDITNGLYDDYITQWALAAAKSPVPVLVRWAPEMNGDWNPWSMGVNSNPVDGSAYVAAYRHVVEVFRANGATNVQWVWNPNIVYDTDRPYPRGSFPLAELYPGDDVVDWVALDGYNWGSEKPWGWKTFEEVFGPSVTEIRRIAPRKPLMVAEVGSAPGARKPAWITEAFALSRQWGIRAVVWFEFDKETDWRLTSSRVSSAAARKAINGYVAEG